MKHLYLLIISTFIVGFAIGVYAYLMTREDTNTLPREEETEAVFEIVADSYGGCESLGCASYRIREDGSYTYLVRHRGGEDETFEDALSEKRMGELREKVGDAPLSRLTESAFMGTCPITFDGIAYRFEVTWDGRRYSLDTCVNDLNGSAFADALIGYFDIFRLLHESS